VAEAQAIADRNPLYPYNKSGAIVGTPELVAESLQAFVDAGVRDFILRFADFPRLDGVRRFEREIAPRLRASAG
jgi:alkanesulfonate monooxygenase SsuD/methylene tetrahydromethanopterin reductase-like flavin-dependent oxidoreductase (luciferase family)